MKRFLQTYGNELLTSDKRSNNFLLIFSPERSVMKCSPVTQSPNLMIEIDKLIYMDIGVYVFYMCLYIYIYIYVYIGMYYLFVRLFIPTYIYIFVWFL